MQQFGYEYAIMLVQDLKSNCLMEKCQEERHLKTIQLQAVCQV